MIIHTSTKASNAYIHCVFALGWILFVGMYYKIIDWLCTDVIEKLYYLNMRRDFIFIMLNHIN